MTKSKKITAPAAPKPSAKPALPSVIAGAKLVPVRSGDITAPCLEVKGAAPSKGSKITAKLANGITYSGVVADTSTADGKTLIHFKNGIQVVR